MEQKTTTAEHAEQKTTKVLQRKITRVYQKSTTAEQIEQKTTMVD